MATVAGRLADRYPPLLLSTAGLAAFAAGLAALALMPAQSRAARHRVALRAVRRGFRLLPVTEQPRADGSVPRERSGGASGVLSTVRVTGQAVGAAGVAIVSRAATWRRRFGSPRWRPPSRRSPAASGCRDIAARRTSRGSSSPWPRGRSRACRPPSAAARGASPRFRGSA